MKPVKSHTSCKIATNFLSVLNYSSLSDLIPITALCFFSALES